MSVKDVEITTRLLVVMGTTGCGKSTVGSAVASSIGAAYIEGDDYHTVENKTKMSAGTALTDEDRWPWLKSLSEAMTANVGITVASCSALKSSYRRFISDTAGEPVLFVHLHGTKAVIASRLAQRKEHFMDTGLLDSQISTLEMLGEDEFGFTVDINQTIDELVQEVSSRVTLHTG